MCDWFKIWEQNITSLEFIIKLFQFSQWKSLRKRIYHLMLRVYYILEQKNIKIIIEDIFKLIRQFLWTRLFHEITVHFLGMIIVSSYSEEFPYSEKTQGLWFLQLTLNGSEKKVYVCIKHICVYERDKEKTEFTQNINNCWIEVNTGIDSTILSTIFYIWNFSK